MIWNNLGSLHPAPHPLTGRWHGLYAVPTANGDTNWLIGPYETLRDLASELRGDEKLRGELAALRIRLGLRATDVPPSGILQRSFGTKIAGANADKNFAEERVFELAKTARDLKPGATAATNRETDRWENKRTFWESLTPQAHHIVEFNNLRDIRVSKDGGATDLDYDRLPAVLLAAEFHQRYITTFLRQLRGLGENALREQMPVEYRALYQERSQLLAPLWQVSQVIFRAAGLYA